MNTPVNLWKPDYLLDIEHIDAQHKVFFDICLNITQASEARGSKTVRMHDVIQMIYTLRSYAFHHFHAEETLLLKHRYPQLYPHMNLHDIFLQKLQSFTKQLHALMGNSDSEDASKAFLELAVNISEFTANWWGEHILTPDKAYAAHILALKGQSPGAHPPESAAGASAAPDEEP